MRVRVYVNKELFLHLLPNLRNTWSRSSLVGSTPPIRYWSSISNKTGGRKLLVSFETCSRYALGQVKQ